MTNNAKQAIGLGTFGGVFTPSILTILGLVLFLRLGYVVGNVGLAQTLLIIALASLVSILTSISLAAIATNLEVRGGGVYYIISRTLGLPFGGAIGLVLFVALSISVGFYCVGLAEGVMAILGWRDVFLSQSVAAGAVLLVTLFAWLGADWATRLQYLVMALLVAALVSFAIGGWAQSRGYLLQLNFGPLREWNNFWIAFAIFFPAVTGFTQGVNMSGDLADPVRSIPRGTALAVGLSIIVYVGTAVLLASSLPREALISNYGSMRTVAAYAPLIDAGVIAATLSSALASLMGAPRILQSLAKDRVFSPLAPFAHGDGPSNNPRRGVLLGGVIALTVVVLGNLNLIAAVVSMFFVVAYGLLNYATYFEARAKSPSFRPAVRWYDPRLSLLGALVCLGVILAINLTAGLVALAVVAAIYLYLERNTPNARWADGQRSHHLQRAREHLLGASARAEHPRDWRPQILAFSNDSARRARLVTFAHWIEGHSGLTTVIKILNAPGRHARRLQAKAELELANDLVEQQLTAFPLVIAADDLDQAVAVAVQSVGIGPTRINTILVNWLDPESNAPDPDEERRFLRNLHTSFLLGCNLIMFDAEADDWKKLVAKPSQDRKFDVWWQDNANGRLMLVLAYLVTRNDDWRNTRIRLLVQAEPGQTESRRVELELALREMRIAADVEVIPRAVNGPAQVAEISGGSDLVFVGVAIRNQKFTDWQGNLLSDVLPQLPVVVLVMAAEELDLSVDPDEGVESEQAAARDALEDMRAARGQLG